MTIALRKISELDTPALLVDLEVMESNLGRMAGFFDGVEPKLRPHFKAHQVLALARTQVQAGAIGITCARISHAEALVEEGIKDVLVANQIAGESLIRRFVHLSRVAPVIVAMDDARVVSDAARLAGNRTHDLNVVADVDLGLHRGGVSSPASALALAEKILEAGLKFRVLMGYAGSVHVSSEPEKQNSVRSALQPLLKIKAMMERQGIPLEIVSCGGTSDYSVAGVFPGVTEVQAGSYLLMDTKSAPFAPEFSRAVTVLSTILSKTAGDRVVADAGVKAVSSEKGLPTIKGHSGLRVRALHAEHALIDLLDPS